MDQYMKVSIMSYEGNQDRWYGRRKSVSVEVCKKMN